MVDFISITEARDRSEPVAAGLPSPDYSQWISHGPDLHLRSTKAGQIQGHCSLWWNQPPPLPSHQLGIIGHFGSVDRETGRELLLAALEKLRQQGCTLAVGPMDGNTWRSYRFVTWSGNEPPFFLEPQNPASYPRMFEECGFRGLAEYSSALTPDLAPTVRSAQNYQARLQESGTQIRTLDILHYQKELDRIYDVSEIAFRSNFLYTPIARNLFKAQYEPLQGKIDSRFVLFAEKENQVVGYVFAIPDFLQLARGGPSTCIVKTLAVLPQCNGQGIGGALLAEVQARAFQAGYKRAIHALMHLENRSQYLSSRYAHEIRRYTLFQKTL